jgi:hypothetical protein
MITHIIIIILILLYSCFAISELCCILNNQAFEPFLRYQKNTEKVVSYSYKLKSTTFLNFLFKKCGYLAYFYILFNYLTLILKIMPKKLGIVIYLFVSLHKITFM